MQLLFSLWNFGTKNRCGAGGLFLWKNLYIQAEKDADYTYLFSRNCAAIPRNKYLIWRGLVSTSLSYLKQDIHTYNAIILLILVP